VRSARPPLCGGSVPAPRTAHEAGITRAVSRLERTRWRGGRFACTPSSRFFPIPYFICGIMGSRYAAPTSRERTIPTYPEANKRRKWHSKSIDKDTSGASPANTSGFLQVSLSEMPRPVPILPAPHVTLLGPRHFRSRLATYRQLTARILLEWRTVRPQPPGTSVVPMPTSLRPWERGKSDISYFGDVPVSAVSFFISDNMSSRQYPFSSIRDRRGVA
jgi:hypothetical protein